MMDIKELIRSKIEEHDVVLFMKGTPEAPRCGFSGQVVHILRQCKVDFLGIDVLENNELRQGIKEFSNWPTLPQLYIRGEFIGGCDIVSEMYQTGELQTLLQNKN